MNAVNLGRAYHLNKKTVWARLLSHLKPPQSTEVITALEADGLQPFIQAALDADQARAPRSDHRHAPSGHDASLLSQSETCRHVSAQDRRRRPALCLSAKLSTPLSSLHATRHSQSKICVMHLIDVNRRSACCFCCLSHVESKSSSATKFSKKVLKFNKVLETSSPSLDCWTKRFVFVVGWSAVGGAWFVVQIAYAAARRSARSFLHGERKHPAVHTAWGKTTPPHQPSGLQTQLHCSFYSSVSPKVLKMYFSLKGAYNQHGLCRCTLNNKPQVKTHL